MATKTKTKSETSAPNREEETLKVKKWRKERFIQVLRDSGMEFEQIEPVLSDLVDSNSSAHDLEGLIEKGCDPETAIRIAV